MKPIQREPNPLGRGGRLSAQGVPIPDAARPPQPVYDRRRLLCPFPLEPGQGPVPLGGNLRPDGLRGCELGGNPPPGRSLAAQRGWVYLWACPGIGSGAVPLRPDRTAAEPTPAGPIRLGYRELQYAGWVRNKIHDRLRCTTDLSAGHLGLHSCDGITGTIPAHTRIRPLLPFPDPVRCTDAGEKVSPGNTGNNIVTNTNDITGIIFGYRRFLERIREGRISHRTDLFLGNR